MNTVRGAAEALVIAGFGAALLGFLAGRLGGDSARAGAVASGRLSAERAVELDAFTWSWHATQLAISAVCLLLSVAVAALILRADTGTDTV